MRDQGRLVEWFDDRGYGFIQPLDPKKDRVFLHIKDFAKAGPRPLVGCALEYEVGLDAKGRYRAQQVHYLKLAQVQAQQRAASKPTRKTAAPRSAMQYLCVAYIVALAGLTVFGLLPAMTLLVIMLVNILTYWLYAQDKEAAQLGARRIPENTLHVLAFLGGWPAAWLAQQRLRHKTKKQPFRHIYFVMIGLHCLALVWLMSPLSIFV